MTLNLVDTNTRSPEMSIGLDLDWIRAIVTFVGFGLDPGYKSLQNLGSGPDLDRMNGKKLSMFVVKRLHFSNFWTLFGLEFHILKPFGLWLNLK